MGVDGVEAQKRQRAQVDAEGEISSRNQAPAKSAQTKVVQIDKAAKWEAAGSNENSTYESGVPEELAVLVKTIRDSSVGSYHIAAAAAAPAAAVCSYRTRKPSCVEVRWCKQAREVPS